MPVDVFVQANSHRQEMLIQGAEAVARGGIGVDIRLLFTSEVSIDGRCSMQRMALSQFMTPV